MNAMNALKPPPPLPSYIFLMTGLDSKFVAARERACEIAAAIAREHLWVFIDDFAAPLHEALRGMFEIDPYLDLGEVPHKKPQDGLNYEALLESLAFWYNTRFPPPHLGQRAFERACESTAINDEHIFVYRDATPDQLKPFIDNIPWKNICIVNLVPHVWPVGLLRPTSSEINVPVSASLTKVLSLIQEAA